MIPPRLTVRVLISALNTALQYSTIMRRKELQQRNPGSLIGLEPLQEKRSLKSFQHQNFLRQRSIIRIISQNRERDPATYSEENKARA